VSDEAGTNLDPRALEDAARGGIAGILFSVFLITGLLLFRLSVRADPLETGTWLKTSRPLLCHGLSHGLLFLAMLFASAAVAGGIVPTLLGPAGLMDSATFTFARAVTYEIMNL
jgi:hypothetical protein